MELKIIDTGVNSAENNMRIDQTYLDSLSDQSQALLHLYEWEKPSITYGYFSQPSKVLLPEGIEKYGLQLAKRPTGGGIIFHSFDLAFSILVPSSHPHFSLNTLENYAW